MVGIAGIGLLLAPIGLATAMLAVRDLGRGPGRRIWRVAVASAAFVATFALAVVGSPGHADRLTLRAAWRDGASDSVWKRTDIDISAGSFEIATAVIPAHMSLIIVDAEGRTLDQHQWSPERGGAPSERAIPSEWLERLLIEGRTSDA